LWRTFSETWRADWRGDGRFSVYQILALVSVAYSALVLYVLRVDGLPPVLLTRGLDTLWHPGLVLFLIGLWAVTFVYYGRSLVTGSRLSVYVCQDRI
jgi:hypothetical protein